jgi:O-antigen/teichoic acid export membrane protein
VPHRLHVISLQSHRGVTRNATALFVGPACVMAVSLVFLLFAARLLGVTEFGRYALARTYFDLLLTLAVTGLGIFSTREIAKNPSMGALYFGSAAPLGIGLAVVMGSALVLVAPLMGYGSDLRTMLALVCLALVPASFATLSEAVFVAIGHAQYVMVGSVCETLLYSSTGVLLLWLGSGAESLFVALVATRSCLAVAYATRLWRRFGRIPWPGSYAFTKRLCRDWRSFALENWLANLTANTGTIVLSVFHGEAAVGLYAAASKITSVGSPLVASFTSAMFPYMTRLYGESSLAFRRLGEDSVKHLLAVAVPGIVIVAVFADRVIEMLYGDAYIDAVPVLRVVIWVFIFNVLNPFVSHLLFARGEQATSLRVGAIGAVTSLALSIALIPTWGSIGAACAVLASTTLAFCLYCAAAFRPDPARVLMMLGKAGIAAASLAGFLAISRRAHPAALTIGALGVYWSVLSLLRLSSVREFSAFVRGLP